MFSTSIELSKKYEQQVNDGRDALLVMSSAYYDRTCLWSADIFTLVWQEFFFVSLISKYLRGHCNGKCGKLS